MTKVATTYGVSRIAWVRHRGPNRGGVALWALCFVAWLVLSGCASKGPDGSRPQLRLHHHSVAIERVTFVRGAVVRNADTILLPVEIEATSWRMEPWQLHARVFVRPVAQAKNQGTPGEQVTDGESLHGTDRGEVEPPPTPVGKDYEEAGWKLVKTEKELLGVDFAGTGQWQHVFQLPGFDATNFAGARARDSHKGEALELRFEMTGFGVHGGLPASQTFVVEGVYVGREHGALERDVSLPSAPTQVTVCDDRRIFAAGDGWMASFTVDGFALSRRRFEVPGLVHSFVVNAKCDRAVIHFEPSPGGEGSSAKGVSADSLGDSLGDESSDDESADDKSSDDESADDDASVLSAVPTIWVVDLVDTFVRPIDETKGASERTTESKSSDSLSHPAWSEVTPSLKFEAEVDGLMRILPDANPRYVTLFTESKRIKRVYLRDTEWSVYKGKTAYLPVGPYDRVGNRTIFAGDGAVCTLPDSKKVVVHCREVALGPAAALVGLAEDDQSANIKVDPLAQIPGYKDDPEIPEFGGLGSALWVQANGQIAWIGLDEGVILRTFQLDHPVISVERANEANELVFVGETQLTVMDLAQMQTWPSISSAGERAFATSNCWRLSEAESLTVGVGAHPEPNGPGDVAFAGERRIMRTHPSTRAETVSLEDAGTAVWGELCLDAVGDDSGPQFLLRYSANDAGAPYRGAIFEAQTVGSREMPSKTQLPDVTGSGPEPLHDR